MRLCVTGTGYVGLVTAAGFADAGHEVVGIDIEERKVRELASGRAPIYEPELDGLVHRGLESGRLRFTADYAEGVPGAEAVFICVGTPASRGGQADGRPDLGAVEASLRSVIGSLGSAFPPGGVLIVMKSTVPVGTNDRLAAEAARLTDRRVELASNPEFLKEGAAVEDFLRPDRVVIGVRSAEAASTLRQLYEPFVRTGAPIVETDPCSAEMAKYAANGMLAARISFMNEIARLCDSLGADVESVRRVVGSDRRIGGSYLFPGPGYGGSCFPKDVQALGTMGREAGIEIPLMEAVDRTNKIQRAYLIEIVRRHFGEGGIAGKTFGVWGLAFKPRTDDVRESAALEVVRRLSAEGAKVAAFDPAAAERAREALSQTSSQVRFAADRYDAAKGVDALVLMTEWAEFRRPDPKGLAEVMRGHVIFDVRNVLDAHALAREGFTVYGIGRPVVRPTG